MHDDAERILKSMLLIRLVEEEIITRYSKQLIRCPVHLSIGQEAISVGVCHHLLPEDKIFVTHRNHSSYLAKGGDLNRMALELHGKLGGCLDGRGGSMHLCDPDAGIPLSVPIVASSIPLAVGAALANKIDSNNRVVVAFFGDAAVEEGVFHEAMNFASLMSLPIIFVCENNLYSVYTHIHKRQPDRPLVDLAVAHDIEALHMDGNNVFAIADAFKPLIAECRKGNPYFVVLDTYRQREHCGVNFDDHLGYRDVMEGVRQKDPMEIVVDPFWEELTDVLKKSMKITISRAFDEAETAAFPVPEMASRYVYA